MESVVRVKKSLRTPIRKMTACVTEQKARRNKHGGQRARGHAGRGVSGKSPPLRTSRPREPSIVRSYQADLDKERKQREARNSQKNAERAAMRAHFRRKYRLAESPKDTNHLRFTGSRVSLPPELSRMIHPETRTKDNSFNLLRTFQGLSISVAALTGGGASRTRTPTPAREEPCRVM